HVRAPMGWSVTLPAHAGELREVELALTGKAFPAGRTLPGLLYDDPEDPVHGFDTLALALSKDAPSRIVLKPRPALGADASAFQGLLIPTPEGKAAVHFRLFALSRDGGSVLLYRTEAAVIRCNKQRVGDAATEASGGFVGNGAGRRYTQGDLGP